MCSSNKLTVWHQWCPRFVTVWWSGLLYPCQLLTLTIVTHKPVWVPGLQTEMARVQACNRFAVRKLTHRTLERYSPVSGNLKTSYVRCSVRKGKLLGITATKHYRYGRQMKQWRVAFKQALMDLEWCEMSQHPPEMTSAMLHALLAVPEFVKFRKLLTHAYERHSARRDMMQQGPALSTSSLKDFERPQCYLKLYIAIRHVTHMPACRTQLLLMR